MADERGMSILLIDDSSMARKMVSTMIRSLRLGSVILAGDGKEAMDVVKSDQDVDFIVCDWNMPRMDGYLFLKWVRSQPGHAKTPFLMATAQGERKQVSMALDGGADAVLPKPFSKAEFESKVKDILRGKSPHAVVAKARMPQRTGRGKLKLTIGHMRTCDHLVLGMLHHRIDSGELTPEHFELHCEPMESWNQVQEFLEDGSLDGALVLAPIAVDLFGCDVPLKLVLLAHKGGSACIRNTVWIPDEPEDLKAHFLGKTVLIPHKLSVQHMIMHNYLVGLELLPGYPGPHHKTNVTFEVIPPMKMPEYMAYNEDAVAAIASEPVGALGVSRGVASTFFSSHEKWRDHPGCVVALRRECVDEFPEAVREFVSLFMDCGRYVAENPSLAAEMGAKFLDPTGILRLDAPLLESVLTSEGGPRTDDLLPNLMDLERMQRYMYQRMGVGDLVDLKQLVDTSFIESFSE